MPAVLQINYPDSDPDPDSDSDPDPDPDPDTITSNLIIQERECTTVAVDINYIPHSRPVIPSDQTSFQISLNPVKHY